MVKTENTEITNNEQTADTTENTTKDIALPADYLQNGYHATTEKGAKYLRAEYVGEYAQTIAAILADMKPSDFSALLRELKRNKKTALPFEARQTAVLEMLPKSLSLVRRKKAPPALIEFIKHNLDNIHNDEDWSAFYRHLEAINSFIIAQHE